MVVNGGFSAVSEALFMRKPMVVIPVPRHAEQWANGESIRRLGLGIVATEEGLEEAIDARIRRIEEFRAAFSALPLFPTAPKLLPNLSWVWRKMRQ